MFSPARSSHDREEDRRMWARNLFAGANPAAFLAFVEEIHSGALDNTSSEARQLLDFCLSEHPNSIVLSLLMHVENSDRNDTRLRCAALLRRIFRPFQEEVVPRLSLTTERETKDVLLRCLQKETYPSAFEALIEVVCQRQWPEAYDYMIQLLKSDAWKDKKRGLLLFEKSASFCAERYLIDADDLSEMFRGFMDQESEDLEVRVAAVGAAVELVLCLATSTTHHKYYDLLICMMKVLSDVHDARDDGLTQRVLAHLRNVAGLDTLFLRPHIKLIVERMLNVAETVDVSNDEARKLVLSFIGMVAEDDKHGRGMIQNLDPLLLKRLFTLSLDRIAFAPEGIEAQVTTGTFTMLVEALQENVVIESLPDCLPKYLKDGDWRRRYSAVTALGIITEGCSKASFIISGTLVEAMLKLWADQHFCVRWATIRAAGQFSKNLTPQAYELFFSCLLQVLDDFDNPGLQIVAASTLLHFSKNCHSDIFRTQLKRILSRLCTFLESGNCTLKIAALMLLASLVDSFKEVFLEDYLAAPKDHDWLTVAKTLECMALDGVADGKIRFMDAADSLWGILLKFLGADFVCHLNVSLEILLAPAFTFDANESAERVVACDALCCFAEELKAELHKFIPEIIRAVVLFLRSEYNTRLRTTAISATPLILHSASSAVEKGLRLGQSITIEMCADPIFSGLLEALGKEKNINILTKILESLDKCIQVAGSYMDGSRVHQFFDSIARVLLACSCGTTELKGRARKGLIKSEKRLLKGCIELLHNAYRAIADCLTSIVKIDKASYILPLFDRLLPKLALMNIKNSREERRIFLQILRAVAEHYGEEAFKHYEARLLSFLTECDLQNPDVCEIVAHGITMCAEFGGSVLKSNFEVIITTLEGILKSPEALKRPDNYVVAHEFAVLALGKICRLHCHGPKAYQVVNVWLGYLPLRNNLAEAKIVHHDLCTMLKKSEKKVLGSHIRYDDLRQIIKIFGEVMWAGKSLATDETLDSMKKLLKRFQARVLASDFNSICSSFPLPIETVIKYSLSS